MTNISVKYPLVGAKVIRGKILSWGRGGIVLTLIYQIK